MPGSGGRAGRPVGVRWHLANYHRCMSRVPAGGLGADLLGDLILRLGATLAGKS